MLAVDMPSVKVAPFLPHGGPLYLGPWVGDVMGARAAAAARIAVYVFLLVLTAVTLTAAIQYDGIKQIDQRDKGQGILGLWR